MKILFLTEQLPWPLNNGGNLRTWHILQGLRCEHDVTVVSHQQSMGGQQPELVPDTISRLIQVPKRSIARHLWHNGRRRGASQQPLFLLKNWSPTLLAAADRLLAAESFDAIHFNHLDTACFALERDWSQLLVFDSHNCLTFLARKAAHQEPNQLRRWYFRREADLLERAERCVAERMNLTLVCSSVDAGNFASLWAAGRYEVVPNGVDVARFQNAEGGPLEPNTLVFTGAMGYYPNEQAAVYFCREVLPLLRATGRPVKALFVGQGPTPQVRALHNGKDIVVTFASILSHFSESAELCVLRLSNRAVAAALLIHQPQATEVPSASSLRAFNSTNANMVMYWHLLKRAIERGQRVFDFGRSTLEGGTFRFKQQWGAEPSPSIWQYHLRRGSIGDLRPDNSKYGLAIRVWQRLPVWLTRLIGPDIVRGIP